MQLPTSYTAVGRNRYQRNVKGRKSITLWMAKYYKGTCISSCASWEPCKIIAKNMNHKIYFNTSLFRRGKTLPVYKWKHGEIASRVTMEFFSHLFANSRVRILTFECNYSTSNLI